METQSCSIDVEEDRTRGQVGQGARKVNVLPAVPLRVDCDSEIQSDAAHAALQILCENTPLRQRIEWTSRLLKTSPRCGEHVVGSQKPAELADGGILRSANAAIAQRQESTRDRSSDARLPALRCVRPRGATTPASETLASTGETHWRCNRGCPSMSVNRESFAHLYRPTRSRCENSMPNFR